MKLETITETCPADPILRVIAGRWKTHIVYLLGEDGAARFNVIQRRLAPVSPKVLTSRLRELARDGLIWRAQEETIPPKVTYGLTDLGREVHEVLKSFDTVGRKFEPVPTKGTASGTSLGAPWMSNAPPTPSSPVRVRPRKSARLIA